MMPTSEDRKNYDYNCRTSPFFASPGDFLKEGQQVRAKFRIWDLPGCGETWGGVAAEAGELGTVIHAQDSCWPTVRFTSGHTTCVTDFEAERA